MEAHPKYTRALASSLPKFERGVSLLCWAFNEETIIESFLRQADAMMAATVSDYEIVVVDDGSRDRTADILRRVRQTLPRLRVLTNPSNMNVGYAARRAIMAASKEFLFWQTVDWSYDLTNLRLFLELLRSHDVVAGVRTQHLTRRSDTVPKAIVSLVNYLLVRLLFRLPLSDYQNVVFYPTRLIQALGFDATSSFANPEALLRAHWRGASIIEVPISFLPRRAGHAKGTHPRAILASVRDIFRFWLGHVIARRPPPPSRRGEVVRLRPWEWETQELRS